MKKSDSYLEGISDFILSFDSFETLKVDHASGAAGPGVFEVAIDRENKRNALTEGFFHDLKSVFNKLSNSPYVKAIILHGTGRDFTAGLDSNYLASIRSDPSIRSNSLGAAHGVYSDVIKPLQEAVASVSGCCKLTIAVIQGNCIGAGVEIACACDIRIGTTVSRYCLKEVPLGIVPDLGGIQRLPHIINPGLAKELIFTGRWMDAEESCKSGFVTHLKADHASAMNKARDIARIASSHSYNALVFTKKSFIFAENHSVEDSLENCALLASNTIANSMDNDVKEEEVTYSNL